MKLFDFTKIKENKFFLLGLLVILVVFIGLDSFMSSFDKSEIKLTNKDIKINELVINEIMIDNKGAYNDPTGYSYDWIELYNGTSKDINLGNYGLSDKDNGETKWLFPETTIKSKEYLVVYLAGETKKGLYTNFSLKKDGSETITLKKASGKVVDAIKTKNLKKNESMARNFNGEWVVTEEITPGFSNNEDGHTKFIDSLKEKNDELIITEILPSNKGNILFNGYLYGYIEVYNNSDKVINLNDYYVSNNINRPFLFRLPNKALKPKESYLIYASDLNKENHASFTLNKKQGTVILSKLNKIVDDVSYEDLPNGIAYIKVNDKFYQGSNISPGYANNSEGKKKFAEELEKNPKELIINEVMSANHKFLPQNGGQYYDWIELYNNSGHEINLIDYTITNDVNNKTLYNLPSKKLKNGEYFVLIASGNKNFTNDTYYHTNFKISSQESLYLYKNDKLVDTIFVNNIPTGYSFGRGKSSGHYYFASPSPKANNGGDSVLEISYNPTFNTESGIYNNKSSLAVELEGAGTIYYTLDGSLPTKKSKVYNSPIILNKTSVIKAINYESGKKGSDVITNSYIVNENHKLPVLSVSLPSSSLTKINTNISTNKAYNAHAELFENNSKFSIDCGMKIFGGDSRQLNKKSYALKFGTKYGKEASLQYKVFPDRLSHEYKTLILRSGSQDMDGSLFRDELVSSIINDYGTVDVQAAKPVVLYINGKYWGIYYIREKIDEDFISNHYNINVGQTNIVRIDYDVTSGSPSAYRNLVNYASSNNLNKDENYKKISTMLDIDNYIDFWIAQMYSNDYDVRNIRYFNNKYIDGGKIKMIGYDFDFAMTPYPGNYYDWMLDSDGMGYYKINNTLLRSLMKSDKFRKRFVERLSYNLKNVWTEEHINKNYNYYYDSIKDEVKRDHERWNFSYDEWLSNTKQMKKWLKNRRSQILSYTKNYFDLSEKEMKQYFG